VSDVFRREIRAWILASCPASMRTPIAGDHEEVWGGRRGVFPSEDARIWLARMAAKGFCAPTWPVAYGGAGLSPAEAAVLDAELREAGCRPPLRSLGLWMLGPVLLRYGSEAQKREHLPRIARGEIRWCQGYSEPGAGSDLAGLSTRAERRGDVFVVNGQKTWTSHADKADWMFCLVRVDPSLPKHEGIGFLLIDMTSPGVRVRPIRLISGASPFCETFFDEVEVPAENLVGAPGQGWTIAKALLEHERASIGKLRSTAFAAEEPLQDLARRTLGDEGGRLPDPVLRDRITQANLDQLAYQLTSQRAAEAAKAGRPPGPESSVLKLYGMELNKRRKELRVVVTGFSGLGDVLHEGGAPPGFTPEEITLTRDWLRSRANSIEGGTTEIQLNIIAKRILGLPD
jgi:alkylation response protein AidB-like acyl-CoA dehydrogenase